MELEDPALLAMDQPAPLVGSLHDQVRLRFWPIVRRRLQDNADIDPLRDDLGEALRRAIVLSAPIDIIRSLLETNPADVTLASSPYSSEPDAASKRNQCSPLHIAAMKFAPSNIVDAILERNSDWCTATDSYGRSPLHILCLCVTNPSTNRQAEDRSVSIGRLVRSVLDRHPEAASMVDRKGNTPLHRIVCWQSQNLNILSRDIARSLLEAQPAAATKVNRAGRDALLHAIHFRAPYCVVNEIITKCPASVTGYRGKAPLLTLVCRNWYHRDQASSFEGADGYNESLLMPRETLAKKLQSSDTRALENGHWNPHHISQDIIRSYCSETKGEVFRWMMTHPGLCPKLIQRIGYCTFDQCLKVASVSTGNFMLHTIASTPPIDEATTKQVEPHPLTDDAKAVCPLSEIVEMYPEAARKTNKAGELPLRLAIESGRRWDSGVRALVKANPTALLYENIPLGAIPHAFEKVVQEDDLSLTFQVMKETIGGILGSCDDSGCQILSPARSCGKKRQRHRTPPKSSAKRLFASPSNAGEQK